MSQKNAIVAAAAVSATLCVSTVLGQAAILGQPFNLHVEGWGRPVVLTTCDFKIKTIPLVDLLRPFAVCHAQVLAIQMSAKNKIKQHLRKDAFNLFLSKDRFVVLTFDGREWWRTQYTQLPQEFVGLPARFFAPHFG